MFDDKMVLVGKESSTKEKCAGCDAECILWSHIDNWKAQFVVATPYIFNDIRVAKNVVC